MSTDGCSGGFVLPDVDEYLSLIADTAGPIGLALGGLTETERTATRAEIEDSLGRFASDAGYELPCVAVCAAASSRRLPDHGLVGVDDPQALDDPDRAVADLGDVHVHPHVVLAGDHLRRAAGADGDLGVVQGADHGRLV